MEKIEILSALEDSLQKITREPVGDGSPYTSKSKFDSIQDIKRLIIKIDEFE